jgi:hypothetical protein
MNRGHHKKAVEIQKKRQTEGAEPPPDDVIAIDPSDLLNPEEVGSRRPSPA